MVRTHIPCPSQENPPCSASSPSPSACNRLRRIDPDLRLCAYARPSWPWSLARRFRCRHCCADNRHCVGVLRREESRLYAVWPPRSPHHSLQLTTVDGQEDSPGFGSEVGAFLSARLAFSCRVQEFVMLQKTWMPGTRAAHDSKQGPVHV